MINSRKRVALLAATASLAGGLALAAPADAQTPSSHGTALAAQAGQTCRNAYVSTTGASGSARICWTSLGHSYYKANVTGTVKDTKGDGKRAALYIHTYDPSGHSYTPRLALATKYGQVRYGSWSSSKVKWGVWIYVCRVDRFNTTYNCSNSG